MTNRVSFNVSKLKSAFLIIAGVAFVYGSWITHDSNAPFESYEGAGSIASGIFFAICTLAVGYALITNAAAMVLDDTGFSWRRYQIPWSHITDIRSVAIKARGAKISFIVLDVSNPQVHGIRPKRKDAIGNGDLAISTKNLTASHDQIVKSFGTKWVEHRKKNASNP